MDGEVQHNTFQKPKKNKRARTAARGSRKEWHLQSASARKQFQQLQKNLTHSRTTPTADEKAGAVQLQLLSATFDADGSEPSSSEGELRGALAAGPKAA